MFQVGGGFLLTSKYSVGRNLPEASSSRRLLPDSGPYNPAPDLYYPDTVRTQTGREKGKLGGRTYVLYLLQTKNEWGDKALGYLNVLRLYL